MRYRFGGEKNRFPRSYELNFKLIRKERYEELLRSKPDKLSIEAMPTGPGQKRVFKVDLSKHKYIVGKESASWTTTRSWATVKRNTRDMENPRWRR